LLCSFLHFQVYDLFDTLVILVGGKVAYWGAAKEAIGYLSNVTGKEVPRRIAAPDYILDVVSAASGDSLPDNWKAKASTDLSEEREVNSKR
jgi:hypothetical protein